MLSKSVITILALGVMLLLTTAPAFCDAYHDGVAAYQSGRYERAAQWFQRAIREGRNQPESMFYLGMSYTHLQQYDVARQAFDRVLQMLPPQHELAVKARNNINYLTRRQIAQTSNTGKANRIMNMSLSSGAQDNYLTYVIPGGKVIHFASSRMPLRVYISSGLSVRGWNAEMRQAVIEAMRAWQSASSGRISFSQTYTEASADIIVKWRKNFTDGILGVSPLETVGNTIVRSDLNLATCYPDSDTPIPLTELKAIAAHEMGHAIGIRGHSPDPNDIMFFSRSSGRQNTLSRRDINTIGMLYRLDPDVQNNSQMSTAQTQQYYALYRQGVKAQTDNRASEAIAYYRQAIVLNGNMAEARFNLGAVLINEGSRLAHLQKLPEARRHFEEAVRLYSDLSRLSQAPDGVKENLDIARSNLDLVNRALQANN